VGAVVQTAVRILTFRATRNELVALDNRHLAFGLMCTWIVGIGRWWDDPDAHLLQHLGLGSVIYVFILAAFLWLLIRPLNPADFNYRPFLTYITLTAPPALLYALPVERWLDLDSARIVNAWFLGIVAAWRVAMLFVYLLRVSQFKWVRLAVAMLLPLCGIVTALTLLNLERAAFNIMGGIREEGTPDSGTSNDMAYEILFSLTLFSIIALPVLLFSYSTIVYFDARPYLRKQQGIDRRKS